MLIELLKETSRLPCYAKKYLNITIETEDDLILFIDHYLYKNKNIMLTVGQFRFDKLMNRTFTFEQFKKEFEGDHKRAIEKLFLYPHNRTVERILIKPLLKGKFTLEQLYHFQMENPLLNSTLAGKKLCQLP